jgi:hypothetical protein
VTGQAPLLQVPLSLIATPSSLAKEKQNKKSRRKKEKEPEKAGRKSRGTQSKKQGWLVHPR